MISITEIMRREIVRALGCTEPSAVALAAAKAHETLGEDPEYVEIQVSGNILKNAMSVGIPGTDLKGIEIASALGCLVGRSELGLEVLSGITRGDIDRAQKFLKQGRVRILLKEDCTERLYIEAKCIRGDKSAVAVIEKFHTNIASVCRNDEVIYLRTGGQDKKQEDGQYQLTFRDIWSYVETVDLSELSFLKEVIDVNSQIAEEGLRNQYGIGVGRHLSQKTKNLSRGEIDFQTYVVSYAAAAADARMAGCPLPVMATTGSGNQGLTASLPVIAAARWLNSDEEKLYRALALSELVTIHVKEYIGKLSALCGCAIAASIGSTCALTYLLGGDYSKLVSAAKNMVADISGIICDGAKSGCALKIATAVAGAIQCAYLALEEVWAPACDGIVCEDIEQTIRNLGELGNVGMLTTDRVILNMMLEGQNTASLNFQDTFGQKA